MGGERSFSSLGAQLAELQTALSDRLGDAEVLLKGGRYAMAVALGLYSLEISLKIRVCVCLGLKSLPKPFEIHDLEGLLILSGLSSALSEKKSRRVKQNWTGIIATSKLLNDLRYGKTSFSQQQAEDFFVQLNDKKHGVLTWISNQP